MKKIIIAIVLVLAVMCYAYVSKQLAEQAYADCMKAGIQSEETCRFYAYQ